MQNGKEELDISDLKNMDMKISVSIGKCRKLFSEILSLKRGDVLKLDKGKDELIDIYANDQLFVSGEMVIVNGKYSVRVVELA